MKQKWSSIILNVVLLLVGVITVFPFVWMILSSFKTNSEIFSLQQSFWPREFTFDNYVSMQTNFNFLRFFGNSLFISITTTVLIVYTSTICGFVLVYTINTVVVIEINKLLPKNLKKLKFVCIET